jgi:hypothetical protein
LTGRSAVKGEAAVRLTHHAFVLNFHRAAVEDRYFLSARQGRAIQAVTYIAQGKEIDGKPSLRYITLIREGARAHELPETYIRFLETVEHAQ